MSFDAQEYEVSVDEHGSFVGCVAPELRGLDWSSTENYVVIAAATMLRGYRTTVYLRAGPDDETFCMS